MEMPVEERIERAVRSMPTPISEQLFYDSVEHWLKYICGEFDIYYDENPYWEELEVYGAEHIARGRIHYINEIKCNNAMYLLDVEYTYYKIYPYNSCDEITFVHSVDNVSVRKVEELAEE